MTAAAFDLAERFQTPVIVLSDLDLGMNDTMSEPFEWDNERKYGRGKVYTEEDLENMKERFGRYRDVDGDGIPYRTLPGTHPTKGAYFIYRERKRVCKQHASTAEEMAIRR